MPIFDFKARFAEAVRSGAKRQTIRSRGKRPPPKTGLVAYLYAGRWTKHVSKLGEHPITSVTDISISAAQRIVRMPRGAGAMRRWVDLDPDEVEQLARADGFANADEFFAFFQSQHGGTFSGWLIKW